MENYYIWRDIFTKSGWDYFPKQRYNLRRNCCPLKMKFLSFVFVKGILALCFCFCPIQHTLAFSIHCICCFVLIFVAPLLLMATDWIIELFHLFGASLNFCAHCLYASIVLLACITRCFCCFHFFFTSAQLLTTLQLYHHSGFVRRNLLL